MADNSQVEIEIFEEEVTTMNCSTPCRCSRSVIKTLSAAVFSGTPSLHLMERRKWKPLMLSYYDICERINGFRFRLFIRCKDGLLENPAIRREISN